MTAAFLQHLANTVGTAHVHTHPTHDLTGWETDWRQRARGKALAVVQPGSTQEVAAVVQACARAQVSLVPQGGNTGLVLGSTPDNSGQQLVLSLKRMQAVRAVDVANFSITAEAGCVLDHLQQIAQENQRLFPLSMASEGSCTLGGNLATNAGGTQVLRYGNARDLCLGLEVVTAEGEIWHGLKGLRKDNTGYDLRDLLVGSEGTLGVITAATMKLYPLPAAQTSAWIAVPSMAQAVALLGWAHRYLGAGLTGFEVMGQFALGLVVKHFTDLRLPLSLGAPFYVLLEYSSHTDAKPANEALEPLLQKGLAQGCLSDAVVAQTVAQAQAFWALRESLPLAQAQEGPNIKHDIALPISQVADFVQSTHALLQQTVAGVRPVVFGHLGDGNLHYNVQAPEGIAASDFLSRHEKQINTVVFDTVMQHHGSISAEHGIGSLKLDSLETYQSPVALQWMRRIKQALDPQGLMNPGRVVRTGPSNGS